MTIIHSPISSFGSKYRACNETELHRYIPKLTSRHQIYVEPFCSSAVVFFNVVTKAAVLNDKDSNIYNFWEVIRNKKDEFENELNFTWIGKSWFDKYKKRNDDVGRAVFFYLCNRSGRSGLSNNEFVFKYNVMPFVKNFSFWKKKMDSMKSLTIWNLDFHDVYERLIKAGGNTRKFTWYIDPPYIEQGEAYSENMTVKDHEDLAKYHDLMKDDPNMHLIISYDDCSTIREMYKGWYIKEVEWTTVTIPRHPNEYHELLISNREIKKWNDEKQMTLL